MDYFKAISEAASSSPVRGDQMIGYYNGLIIVALLLFIYWCLIRMKNRKKPEFPKFCDDCLFLVQVSSGYCRKKCKFHPHHKDSRQSYYQKKAPST